MLSNSLKVNDIGGLTLGAPGSGPAGRASAVAVVGATLAAVKALAVLGAVDAVGTLGAAALTVLALPSGQALAHPCHVVALGTVLAVAALRAVLPEAVGRAGMLARHAQIAWTTNVLAGHVVARHIACGKSTDYINYK